MIATVAAVHLAATLMMVGVIWMVQLVHYPLFQMVGRESFVAYERSHCNRMSFVVVPVMVVELGTALGLVALTDGVVGTWAMLGLALVGLIWVTTFCVHVPCHDRLGRGFDESAWRTLVRANWIRTLAWTARAGIAFALWPTGGM